MANLQEIKEKIKAANEIGRGNLATKGVTLPETATTSDIMQNIKNIRVSYGDTVYSPEGVGF